jgi:hypothetical protein
MVGQTTIAKTGTTEADVTWPAALEERARAYAEAARAPAILRAYAADWCAFTSWCADRSMDALPATPHTVALFLADVAGRPSLRRKPISSSCRNNAPRRPSSRQAAPGRYPDALRLAGNWPDPASESSPRRARAAAFG